jgi:hypothetical protein
MIANNDNEAGTICSSLNISLFSPLTVGLHLLEEVRPLRLLDRRVRQAFEHYLSL